MPWGGKSASQDELGQTTYYSFDAVGNQNAVTSPLGHTAYYLYDEVNRRTAPDRPSRSHDLLPPRRRRPPDSRHRPSRQPHLLPV